MAHLPCVWGVCLLPRPLSNPVSVQQQSYGHVTLSSLQSPCPVPALLGTLSLHPPWGHIVGRKLPSPRSPSCSEISGKALLEAAQSLFVVTLANYRIGMLFPWTRWGGTGSTWMPDLEVQAELQNDKRLWPKSWECELGADRPS